MKYTKKFYQSVLDSVSDHIVVVDKNGAIQYTNSSWIDFAIVNKCKVTNEWLGISYLEICDAVKSDKYGKKAAKGIRKVIQGDIENFYLEYPCHSPTEKRWFMMHVASLNLLGEPYFVISHKNITERKLAEEKVKVQSLTDDLTGLANRRHFNKSLKDEWDRAARLNQPLSLIILDIDYFKEFNDHYGHLAGDDCLRRLGKMIIDFGKRPGDLCARYGGEEFAIILSNTDLEGSKVIAHKLCEAVSELNILHSYSKVHSTVTISLGLSVLYPDKEKSELLLIELADNALYCAKRDGRNRVKVSENKELKQVIGGN